MTPSTARVTRETRKPRTGETMRGSTNYIYNGTNADSGIRLRLQRLGRDFALFGPLAETVALLAWGLSA